MAFVTPGGVEQVFPGHGEHIARVRAALAGIERQHLPRRRVGACDAAVGVEREQAVAVVTGLVARPVQPQGEGVRRSQQPAVFDAARRAAHQVLEGWAFGHFDTREVQHAGAQTVRPEHRCAGAAVDAGVVKKVLSAVQPDRLQLGQCRADGGGAHGAFGQVHAHAGNHVGTPIAAVYRAVHVDHDALGIGEDGEVADVAHGPHQLGQHRPRGLHQGLAFLLHPAHARCTDGIKTHALSGRQAPVLATRPAALQPGRQLGHRLAAALMQQQLPGLGNGVHSVVRGHAHVYQAENFWRS